VPPPAWREIPQRFFKGSRAPPEWPAMWPASIRAPATTSTWRSRHGSPEGPDRQTQSRIRAELGIELIATNDAHYLTPTTVEAHDASLVAHRQGVSRRQTPAPYGHRIHSDVEGDVRLFPTHLEPAVVARADRQHRCGADKLEAYDILERSQMPAPAPPPTRIPRIRGELSAEVTAACARSGLQDSDRSSLCMRAAAFELAG